MFAAECDIMLVELQPGCLNSNHLLQEDSLGFLRKYNKTKILKKMNKQEILDIEIKQNLVEDVGTVEIQQMSADIHLASSQDYVVVVKNMCSQLQQLEKPKLINTHD